MSSRDWLRSRAFRSQRRLHTLTCAIVKTILSLSLRFCLAIWKIGSEFYRQNIGHQSCGQNEQNMGEAIWMIGGGGLARGVADIAMASGQSIAGLVVEDVSNVSWFPGRIVTEQQFFDDDEPAVAVIAIGDNDRRCAVAERMKARRCPIRFATIIHPCATVSATAHIDAGSIIFAGTVISADARLGQHVVVYSGCLIEHDCTIGDFVSFGPGAALGGNVRVGTGSFIGLGSCVGHGREVGPYTVIGMGAVVNKDIPELCVAVGSPCRVIRSRCRGDKYL